MKQPKTNTIDAPTQWRIVGNYVEFKPRPYMIYGWGVYITNQYYGKVK